MRTRVALFCFAAALTAIVIRSGAQSTPPPPTIHVGVNQPGAAIPSTLFGLFFEDINFAADGGIYAERVKNRSFEFPDPLMGWKRAAIENARGSFAVGSERPASDGNPHYLRVTSDAGAYGVTNDGFRGIGIEKDSRYTFTVLARRVGEGTGTIRAELETNRNISRGSVALTGLTTEWRKYRGTIVAEATEPRARLRVLVDGPATVDLDMVSLFPEDTWERRENGLRTDLVKLLADIHPGFLRFPGGCIVEGRFLESRYQWKTTIGEPAERKLIINRWNDEFPPRATPDYYQSFGLGFFEYFQLSEDIGAAPLPILNCGMACQYNSAELAALDALDPYIQDALDLVEFANGPVTSTWGAKRAAMGHPASFNLTMIGIGNEQWGPQYIERYARFSDVFKARHPEITLIASADPSWRSDNFPVQWDKLRALKAGYVDEHFYAPPDWFLQNTGRYDSYPRTGPKLFVGEYAAHLPPRVQGMRPSTLGAALAEAAFMTGLERNADVVGMSSYAPLFAHVDAWQWTPNLIWFDNFRSYGTPSYYVQQLFGENRGSTILPVTINGSKTNGQDGVYASASLDAKTREVIVKMVNPTGAPHVIQLALDGPKTTTGGTTTTLTGDPDAENSLSEPTRIAPRIAAAAADPSKSWTLPPYSLTIGRVATQ